ncbi:YeiH family protein [Paenirhodobacter enshiensis]|uniref:YeiH family protein n=1 Tax=Paenirhodobacter enshiensis TaxID=1105367 RepID=UPI0035B2352F
MATAFMDGEPGALRRFGPGLAVSFALAVAATLVWKLSGEPVLASPMVIAMVAGMVLRNAGLTGAGLAPGNAIALRPVLRTGIVLLGFRLTLGDLGALGGWGLAMIVTVVTLTFVLTRRMGRVLGVSPQLSELIAAGTSICGASAVLGVNTVTRARDEDVAYAIACVTIFGSLSMLGYPLLQSVLGFDDHAYGLWVGTSLHEVAQAVGAGLSVSDTAGETATIAKLSRVVLLAPLILGLGLIRHEARGPGRGQPVPLFVLGFLAAVIVNTVLPLPKAVVSGLLDASGFLLAMALGAMGLETSLAQLRREGLRPLLLGAFGWLFIATAGATGVFLLLHFTA